MSQRVQRHSLHLTPPQVEALRELMDKLCEGTTGGAQGILSRAFRDRVKSKLRLEPGRNVYQNCFFSLEDTGVLIELIDCLELPHGAEHLQAARAKLEKHRLYRDQ